MLYDMTHIGEVGEAPGAIRDWQDRQTLYEAREWQTLSSHIDPALAALRGLARTRDNVQAFAQSMQEYEEVVDDPDIQKALESTAQEISAVAHRESALEIPLISADTLIRRATEREELKALTDPDVAKDFIWEALVAKPRFGPRISPEECVEVLAFNDDIRPSGHKAVLCAQLVYMRAGTMSAEGIYDWLNDTLPDFNQQTPREIINSGSDEVNAALLAQIAAARN